MSGLFVPGTLIIPMSTDNEYFRSLRVSSQDSGDRVDASLVIVEDRRGWKNGASVAPLEVEDELGDFFGIFPDVDHRPETEIVGTIRSLGTILPGQLHISGEFLRQLWEVPWIMHGMSIDADPLGIDRYVLRGMWVNRANESKIANAVPISLLA